MSIHIHPTRFIALSHYIKCGPVLTATSKYIEVQTTKDINQTEEFCFVSLQYTTTYHLSLNRTKNTHLCRHQQMSHGTTAVFLWDCQRDTRVKTRRLNYLLATKDRMPIFKCFRLAKHLKENFRNKVEAVLPRTANKGVLKKQTQTNVVDFVCEVGVVTLLVSDECSFPGDDSCSLVDRGFRGDVVGSRPLIAS